WPSAPAAPSPGRGSLCERTLTCAGAQWPPAGLWFAAHGLPTRQSAESTAYGYSAITVCHCIPPEITRRADRSARALAAHPLRLALLARAEMARSEGGSS